jgi:type IV secretion system protein TrbI
MDHPLHAAPPPKPQRLNALALGVAAVLILAGVVVAAYYVFHRPAVSEAARTPPPSVPAAPSPTFLARPPAPREPVPSSNAPETPEARAAAEMAALDAYRRAYDADTAQGANGSNTGAGYADPALAGGPDGAGAPPPAGAYASAQAPAAPRDPRREAYDRALRSPLEPSGDHAPPPVPALAPASPASAAAPSLPALPPFPSLDQLAFGPGTPGATGSPSRGAEEAGRAPEDLNRSFLAAARTPRPTALPLTLERPASPYVLQAGTVLPALLLTGVNSDLPGEIEAQVSWNVYDSLTQSHLLIPRGSRLLGSYSNQVALGQARLLVAWDRLILPDGTSLSFPGLPALATSGEAGLPAHVESHLGRVFGTAVLLSIVGAGAQLSQPQESSTLGTAASPRQVAAASLGQQLSTVAADILHRQLSVSPTLSLPPGTAFDVYLNGDVTLPGPYAG